MNPTLFALAASVTFALAAPAPAVAVAPAAPVAAESPHSPESPGSPELELSDAQVAAIAALAESGQAEVDAALARGDAAGAESAGQRTMDAILAELSADQVDTARRVRPAARPLLRRERGLLPVGD
jgi:hypothetical protein